MIDPLFLCYEKITYNIKALRVGYTLTRLELIFLRILVDSVVASRYTDRRKWI